jgi:hypothetical protein
LVKKGNTGWEPLENRVALLIGGVTVNWEILGGRRHVVSGG